MKKDLDGFWGRLPPEAQQLVESFDRGVRKQESRVASRQTQDGSFSGFERMIMGEEVSPDEMEVQEDDRMFDPPEAAPAPAPAREAAPAPARKRGRKSLRSLIESMENK